MPINFEDEDVRIQKTYEALIEAMSKLLELRNFNQITVKDLCEEAQISRATFYSHFQDKYDLLDYWLTKSKSENLSECYSFKKKINDFVNNNGKIVKHLTEGANDETIGLLCDYILSILGMGTTDNGQLGLKYSVLSKFCCGGIRSYLEWQAKNKSRPDLKEMDSYFYDILDVFRNWNEEHI